MSGNGDPGGRDDWAALDKILRRARADEATQQRQAREHQAGIERAKQARIRAKRGKR